MDVDHIAHRKDVRTHYNSRAAHSILSFPPVPPPLLSSSKDATQTNMDFLIFFSSFEETFFFFLASTEMKSQVNAELRYNIQQTTKSGSFNTQCCSSSCRAFTYKPEKTANNHLAIHVFP